MHWCYRRHRHQCDAVRPYETAFIDSWAMRFFLVWVLRLEELSDAAAAAFTRDQLVQQRIRALLGVALRSMGVARFLEVVPLHASTVPPPCGVAPGVDDDRLWLLRLLRCAGSHACVTTSSPTHCTPTCHWQNPPTCHWRNPPWPALCTVRILPYAPGIVRR